MVPYSVQESEFQIPGGTNFLIRIQFRQNSTWQGTIQWLEEDKTLSFRSMLEMIHLMEEAVKNHANQERQRHTRTWSKQNEEEVAIPGENWRQQYTTIEKKEVK